jgi:hypothetical protein
MGKVIKSVLVVLGGILLWMLLNITESIFVYEVTAEMAAAQLEDNVAATVGLQRSKTIHDILLILKILIIPTGIYMLYRIFRKKIRKIPKLKFDKNFNT